MKTEDLIDALGRAGLSEAFAGPGGGDRAATLARSATLIRAQPGTVLWRAGAEPRGLHVVLSGSVRVLRARHGRQHLVHVSGPGATLGEAALFGDRVYPATAVVARSAEILLLPAGPVRALTAEYAPFAHALLTGVAHRVGVLVDRLEANTLREVRARLAASLVGLAAESRDGIAVPGVSQAEWAEDLGTVREVLARELGRLRRAGIVVLAGRGRFRVVDPEALEGIALGTDRTRG